MKTRRTPSMPHARARRLRRVQTDAEARLWSRLRARRLGAVRFHRQFPVGDFIADFCCREKRLVVELDGGQHTDQMEGDRRRTALLAARGYRVLRFWNNDVLSNVEGVVAEIARALELPSP